jgi:hypothetical protein
MHEMCAIVPHVVEQGFPGSTIVGLLLMIA